MALFQFFLNRRNIVVFTSVIISFFSVTSILLPRKAHNNEQVVPSKKLYAVFANDNTDGMTHALFDAAIQQFAADGYQVDTLNLYDRASEMPYFKHDRTHMESYPFFLENKQRFLDADVLLIVFPVYWYSVPAILKTWIDMLSGWSYKYESGQYAQPLHNIKRVIVLYACAQATSPKNSEGLSAVEYQISETFKFIGVSDVTIYGVSNVYGLQKDDAQMSFNEVKTLCKAN